jgi:hypothetical protein
LPGFRLASAALRSNKVPGTIDFADAAHVDDWLRHPVFGDPSFDSFEHAASNPVFRGSFPREWPVNGFYFIDPVSGNHYLYVGAYARGYIASPSRSVLFRSSDAGVTWSKLPGWVLPEDKHSFDANGTGAGHMPDVTVVYFDRRYHLVYDWTRLDVSNDRLDSTDGGIAYAWADKPEGPFHRDPQPILRLADHPNLAGRYNRPYAATLIRRKKDWLITGLMDIGPFGWAIFVITAATPQGPWTNPVLVRNVESDYFHPPLMEGFPAFTHGSYLYAPATSVAKNRDFQCIFRALIEQAELPAAWSLYRHGSLWHSEDRENEYYGIWCQTFSGAIDRSGTMHVLFPSKDPHNVGTINTAVRKWNEPFAHGFHMSAHRGRSLTILRQTCAAGTLNARFHLRGTARLLWDYSAPLGPDQPTSDSTLHKLTLTRHAGLEMGADAWRIVQADDSGALTVHASGARQGRDDWTVAMMRNGKILAVCVDGKAVWKGQAMAQAGAIGWLLEPDTYLSVSRFSVEGQLRPAHRSYLFTEGWLDIAEDPARWQEVTSPDFRYGVGAISRGAAAAAKWSVVGRRFTLYSPKGPDYGTIRVSLDGQSSAVVDLHAPHATRSAPVWSGTAESGDYHAIVVTPLTTSRMPLDCLDVDD